MKAILCFLTFLLVMTIPTNSVFGHGLGGETHPPISLDGRDVTLSVNISPSTFDPNDTERYIKINLSESKSQAVVEHVTFALEMSKNGEQIFRRHFHDDLGDLTIKVINDGSNVIDIKGDKSPGIEAWMRTDTEPVIMTGPVFDSGGLYNYKVEILTADSDFNFLDKRMELSGAISLAEYNTYDVNDSSGDSHQLKIISYFDTIENFEFKSNKLYFSMPFDWNQDLEQISVLHQEIRIPKDFSELVYTKYEAKANDVSLQDTSVTIDDYSNDGRTVHVVINKEELKQIKDQAMQKSDSKIYFELGPSKDIVLPLEAVTPDLRYRAYLSWEPEIVKANEDVTFLLKLEELYTDKSNKSAEYTVKIYHKEKEIFQKHVSGTVNTETPDTLQFKFTPEDTGTIRFDVIGIEDYPLSNVNFLVAVQPQEIPKFPITLTSMSETNPNEGKYLVDLTWFPEFLELGESEFVMTFLDKDTRIPVKDTPYDFVLIKNDTEIYRKSGMASAGGSFENFVFVESESGDVKIRIEKIAGTDEYVELQVNVAPEFPFGALITLVTVLIFVTVISKVKYLKAFFLNTNSNFT